MESSVLIYDHTQKTSEELYNLLTENGYVSHIETSIANVKSRLHNEGNILVINDSDSLFHNHLKDFTKIKDANPLLNLIVLTNESDQQKLVDIGNLSLRRIFTLDFNPKELLSVINDCQGLRKQISSSYQALVPGKRNYLPCKSHDSRRFLEKAWKFLQEKSHIFVTTPKGSETKRILQELSSLKPSDSVKPLLISAPDLLTPQTQMSLSEKVSESNEYGKAIGISNIQELDPSKQKELLDFLQGNHPSLKFNQDVQFVAFIDKDSWSQKSIYDDSLVKSITEEAIEFPQLKNRIGDITAYLSKILSAATKAKDLASNPTFTTDAIQAIFQYNWPGNYDELEQFVMKFLNEGLPKEINSSIVYQKLGANFELKPHDLKAYLSEKQNQYFAEGSYELDQIKDIFELDPILSQDIKTIEDLSLLFPELVHEVSIHAEAR